MPALRLSIHCLLLGLILSGLLMLPATENSAVLAAPGMSGSDHDPWPLSAVYHPETLPAEWRQEGRRLDASAIIRRAFQTRPQSLAPTPLSTGRAPLAQAPVARPVLNREQILDSPHFRIHFTYAGRHAVRSDDRDVDGIPDYVELIAAAAERSYRILVGMLGWPAPLPDDWAGGDDRTDIYLLDLAGAFLGYTYPDTDLCGPNPVTPTDASAICPAYLVLDNDMEEAGPDAGALTRITLAHEFTHVLQYGLDAREPANWLWEAWAVWSEEQVFDEVNAYYALLPDLFNAPDEPLDAHPYADVLLPLWLSEHISPIVVRDTWLQARRYDGMAALEAALHEHGIVPAHALLSYQTALVVRYPCPQLAPYCWEEGAAYPSIRWEGELAERETWNSQIQGNRKLAAYGVDVLRLNVDRPGRLILRSVDLKHLALQLVVFPHSSLRRADVVRGAPADSVAEVRLDDVPANTRYLVVISAPAGEPRAGYALTFLPDEDIPIQKNLVYLPWVLGR